MKTEKIAIQNLKCGGCAATIKEKLNELHGVQNVDVDVDNDVVNVTYTNDAIVRKQIGEMLSEIGYPEIGTDNNLFKKAQSYMSCAIGRMKK